MLGQKQAVRDLESHKEYEYGGAYLPGQGLDMGNNWHEE